MAPPAGTSSMLRSRRRDATLKPNRTLDRSASRGMLYENEELRLRTININAEVEKGQNYIKKLRRENEQLKREIWNLREEYERLESYVKSREQSENEEEDEDDFGEVAIAAEPTDVAGETVPLETVVEEDEQQQQQQDQLGESIDDGKNVDLPQDSAAQGADVNPPHGDVSGNCDVIVGGTDARGDVVVAVVLQDCVASITAESCGPRDGRAAASVTADVLASDVGRGDDPRDGGLVPRQEHQHPPDGRDDRLAVDCAGQDVTTPQMHDAAILQPHTACFDTGNNRQLHDLTVDEVIDAIQDTDLRDKLRTVCLTDDRCYMTFANAECMERALHTAFRIRDQPVLLMDTGAGAVILSLTGLPDAVTDKEVLKCLKKYGTIIGGVERKTVRGGTTGVERYVRVRPTLGAPRYLWFGSDKVIVRQLTEHETGTMNSIARRKSFRSQIKLNLKMAPSSPITERPPTESKENGGGGIVTAATGAVSAQSTSVSVQNEFRFPTDPKTGTGPPPATAEPKTAEPKTAEPKTAASTNSSCKSTGSPKRPAKGVTNDGGPISTGPAESSPLRSRRRPSLMGFRRDTVKYRGGSVSRADGAEDNDSDTSTICRRKLSITGRERAEKVPWCGCWGNGCL